ncbi:GDSL esterase/lipase [Nymphaea thermarum]|nr:GDSL esterase/lipase [Nymphaea thermarum]
MSVWSLRLLCVVTVLVGGCRAANAVEEDPQKTSVPALFIFGDSLVDVGNNNYLKLALDKANFPHNGIDYAGQKATGRFSNGMNSADFMAQKLGLAISPPYLSLNNAKGSSSIMGGVSFASGGAGILDGSPKPKIFEQTIPLNKQIEFYSTVYGQFVEQLGSIEAQKYLSRSLFAVVIGSNDILGYFKPTSSMKQKYSPQQYLDLLMTTLKGQLQRIYNLGARKIVSVGVGPIGCSPKIRARNETEGCDEETNDWCARYNEAVVRLLQNLKSELKDFNYSFFNTYLLVHDFIERPSSHGFLEVKAACCGLGKLNAIFPCTPISHYCGNRSDHVFWDFYHPTEAASRMLADSAFDGSPPFVYPFNVRKLSAM